MEKKIDWITNKTQMGYTILSLLSLDDPALRSVDLDLVHYNKTQIRTMLSDKEHMSAWLKSLAKAHHIFYRGVFENGQEVTMTYKDEAIVKIDHDIDTFIEELEILVKAQFQDAFTLPLYQGMCDFKRNHIILNQQLLLDARLSYTDFQKTGFYREALEPRFKDRIVLSRPVSMLDREWVMTLSFGKRLKVISCQLIMAMDDNQAQFMHLDEDTLKLGFDQAIAKLDKATGLQGSFMEEKGIVCYGYEHYSVMIAKDPRAGCINLLMLFAKEAKQ